jgi:hypothetical protein
VPDHAQNQTDDTDPILAPLLAAARRDPDTLGIILHGSRGAGVGDERSDYDLVWVLTDTEYERRQDSGEPLGDVTYAGGRKLVEIDFTCPRRLADTGTPEWVIQGLAPARVLLDKSGEVTACWQALVALPEKGAREQIAELFDGYLNAFYRSMKAAHRGNELGARLQAAESIIYLVRTLFALERRRTPFHDRLAGALDSLEGQGWAAGELHDDLLAIMRTADPNRQRHLEDRVEELMRARGYGGVIGAWEGEIERVKGE